MSSGRLDLFDVEVVPDGPGSYQFYEHDVCLYVGKALSLRNRLRCYRRPPFELGPRIAEMVARATRVEWVETPSEIAALVVEASLIAAKSPLYNIRLREAHPYLSLAIDSRHGPARLRLWRGAAPDGVEPFGPFPGLNTKELFEAVLAAAPLRSCGPGKFAAHERLGRGCLLADIGKCVAPCLEARTGTAVATGTAVLRGGQAADVGYGGQADYEAVVDDARALLSGRGDRVVARLEDQMRALSQERRFEHAALVRDRVTALRRLVLAAHVHDAAFAGLDADVWAVSGDGAGSVVQVIEFRNGHVVGSNSWHLDSGPAPAPDVRHHALMEWYARARRGDRWPAVVVVDGPVADRDECEALLVSAAPRKVVLRRRGFDPLVAMAQKNAESALMRVRATRACDAAARAAEAAALATALELSSPPLRIEAIDISHAAGRSTVSVVVVLEDGLPRRDAYRRFVLDTSGGDDYAAIAEVVTRRFDPANPANSTLPGLLLIDGGPGQLAAATRALAELRLDVPVVSLAKRFELIHTPAGDVVELAANSPARLLLQRARDATHAASNAAQRRLESQRLRADWLESLPGIGGSRAARVRKAFGSARALDAASREAVDALSFLPSSARAALNAALEARRAD